MDICKTCQVRVSSSEPLACKALEWEQVCQKHVTETCVPLATFVMHVREIRCDPCYATITLRMHVQSSTRRSSMSRMLLC